MENLRNRDREFVNLAATYILVASVIKVNLKNLTVGLEIFGKIE